jgi:DNA polymerase (family 10)
MDNASIAEFLSRIALLLELKGENPFKIRSFGNAANTAESLEEKITDLHESGELTKVKGIGKGIAENIGEYIVRGSSELLDALEEEVPEGLVEMTRIRGLGPGRVKAIHDKLDVSSVGELEYACLENRLVELKGFGAKSQAAILKEIQFLKASASFFHLHYALHTLRECKEVLKDVDGVKEAAVAGQVRRFLEVVNTGSLVVAATDAEKVLVAFEQNPDIMNVSASEDGGCTALHRHGLPIELHVVEPDLFAFALFQATGSPAHVEQVKAAPAESEEAIYKAAGLPYIPPELREGKGELEAEIPDLVEVGDLRGILHVHTTYSDGNHSIREMADATRELGFEYLGITDHSRTAAYAGGLSVERLLAQGEEIKALNKRYRGFRILHGIESDILKDGSLDYPDEVLHELDFVIASVHSGFRMDRESMTERIVTAVRHPTTRILGHPTGRLLLGREGYDVDLEAVLEACREYGVMVEINANPHRLDLDWRWLEKCRERGILVPVNPDAHRIETIGDVRYGVGIARKGWLEARHVANTLSLDALLEHWE